MYASLPDSDLKNPDANLQVTFYEKTLKNEYASKQAKLADPNADDVNYTADYYRIEIPGNETLAPEGPVQEVHKKRFPMQWAAYQQRMDMHGMASGIPIEQWPRVNGTDPRLALQLRNMRFGTIQSIAYCSDSQCASIGMLAGVSAFTFRDEAKNYLLSLEAKNKLTEADTKEAEAQKRLDEANAKIAAQQEQHAKDMEEMKEQMRQLLAMAQVKPETEDAPQSEAPRRGRPPRVQESA